MKTIATSLIVFFIFLLLVSCSTEDMETPPSPLPPVVIENNCTDAMMQRDSISKDGDEIDPPVRPKP